MKKITSLFLVISILVSSSFVSNAASIDDQLIQRGFPSDVIKEMLHEQKIDILSRDTTFKSSKVIYLNENIDTSKVRKRRSIPSADLSFRITTTVVHVGSTGKKYLRVYTNYDWKKGPGSCFTDLIGVAWDSKYFRVVKGDYKYFCRYEHNGHIENVSDNVVSYSNTNGVGWDIDIKPTPHVGRLRNFGFCAVSIEKRASTPSNIECELFANYVHIKASGSIGLIFGPLSVSFNGSASHDSRGTEEFLSF